VKVLIIGTVIIKLYAPWVHSLKEKRMVVKSIVGKVQHKYNISIAEVDTQDFHQTITLGAACVTDETRHANSILQELINYIEENTEASLEEVTVEIL
jgi:uncharacterized protein YlxP (DUF503 family)